MEIKDTFRKIVVSKLRPKCIGIPGRSSCCIMSMLGTGTGMTYTDTPNFHCSIISFPSISNSIHIKGTNRINKSYFMDIYGGVNTQLKSHWAENLTLDARPARFGGEPWGQRWQRVGDLASKVLVDLSTHRTHTWTVDLSCDPVETVKFGDFGDAYAGIKHHETSTKRIRNFLGMMEHCLGGRFDGVFGRTWCLPFGNRCPICSKARLRQVQGEGQEEQLSYDSFG